MINVTTGVPFTTDLVIDGKQQMAVLFKKTRAELNASSFEFDTGLGVKEWNALKIDYKVPAGKLTNRVKDYNEITNDGIVKVDINSVIDDATVFWIYVYYLQA